MVPHWLHGKGHSGCSGSSKETGRTGKDGHCLPQHTFFFFFCLSKILFIFRERGREGERQGEKHQCMRERFIGCLSHSCNPGMCPDRESHWQLFGLQPGTQSTEPHRPGPLAPCALCSITPSHSPRSFLQPSCSFLLVKYSHV